MLTFFFHSGTTLCSPGRRPELLFTTLPSAALGGVLTFFFHYETDFPEVLEFTHATNTRYR